MRRRRAERNATVASEAGHYRVFLDLARELPDVRRIEKRWEEMLEKESRIIREQPSTHTMHSGFVP